MRGDTRTRLVIFALVSLVAVGYAAVKYARLADRVVSPSYAVTVQFPTSGGIFEGAEVTLRGVLVGRVEDVDLSPDGIEARIRIGDRWQVPSDVVAHVRNRSAVGEQYVDLVPSSTGAPYLADGAEIPRARTTVPLPEEVLIKDIRDFSASVPLDDLRTVVSELGTGFGGRGDEIQRIIDGSNTLTQVATAHLPQTIALLRSSEVVLRTQNEAGSSIRSFARDLSSFTGAIRKGDAELRTTLRGAAGFAQEFRALLAATDQDFPALLAHLHVLNSIGAEHLPHIEQALVALPWSVKGTIVGARHGRGQFVIATSDTPVSCKAGYLPPSTWRSTLDLRFLAPDYSVTCRDGGGVLPRGSHHRLGPVD